MIDRPIDFFMRHPDIRFVVFSILLPVVVSAVTTILVVR